MCIQLYYILKMLDHLIDGPLPATKVSVSFRFSTEAYSTMRAICKATGMGQTELLELLLKEGFNVVGKTMRDRLTALETAQAKLNKPATTTASTSPTTNPSKPQ
jgi:hypothetical protein